MIDQRQRKQKDIILYKRESEREGDREKERE